MAEGGGVCRNDVAHMQCPKCHFESETQTTECLRCGIVFAKYVPDQPAIVVPEAVQSQPELRYRVFALPAALILARLLVKAVPSLRASSDDVVTRAVRGHAVTAWLSGFTAMPGPWFTPVSSERSYAFAVIVGLCLVFAGFEAWKRGRWVLLAGAAAALILQFVLTRLYSDQAQAIIIFVVVMPDALFWAAF